MQADALDGLAGFAGVELPAEVQLETGLSAIRVAGVAGAALVGRAGLDLGGVPVVAIFGVLGEADERPVVGLERVALRAVEGPVVEVGRGLLQELMEVVRRRPALACEDVLGVPRELGRPSHRFLHVTFGPAPTLVTEDVLGRDALQARLRVGRAAIDNHPLKVPDRRSWHIVLLLALNHLRDGVEEGTALTQEEVVGLVLVHLKQEHIARVVHDEVSRR